MPLRRPTAARFVPPLLHPDTSPPLRPPAACIKHTPASPNPSPSQVIRADNQRNAALAVKAFLDLHKSFRNAFEPQFNAFVEFASQALKDFPASLAAAFDGPDASPPGDAAPAARSFKVLAELPLTMLGLMQVYGQAAKPPMLAMLPALAALAAHRGPELASLPRADGAAADAGAAAAAAAADPDAAAALEAASVRPEFLAAVADLRAAQVRALNCLAVLLRHWQAELAEYQKPILDATFYLFRCAWPRVRQAAGGVLLCV